MKITIHQTNERVKISFCFNFFVLGEQGFLFGNKDTHFQSQMV